MLNNVKYKISPVIKGINISQKSFKNLINI